jgi:hypothetical protein
VARPNLRADGVGHLRPQPRGRAGIKDKKIEFTVAQQPYLQGYRGVDSLWLQLSTATTCTKRRSAGSEETGAKLLV